MGIGEMIMCLMLMNRWTCDGFNRLEIILIIVLSKIFLLILVKYIYKDSDHIRNFIYISDSN